ncbi:hypothetical protein ACWFNE_20310 [Cellulomonas sp. NPDC055163]
MVSKWSKRKNEVARLVRAVAISSTLVVFATACTSLPATPAPVAAETMLPSASPSPLYSDFSSWTSAQKAFIQEFRTAATNPSYAEATGILPNFSEEAAAQYLRFGDYACERLVLGDAWESIAIEAPYLPQDGAFELIGKSSRFLCPEAEG